MSMREYECVCECECIQLNGCNCIGQVDSFCRLAVGDCSDVVVDVPTKTGWWASSCFLRLNFCSAPFRRTLSAHPPLVPTCACPSGLNGSARLLLVIRVRPPRSHILLSCTHSDCLLKVASFILYKHWKLFSFSLQLALPLPLPLPPSGFFSFHSFGFLLPSPP